MEDAFTDDDDAAAGAARAQLGRARSPARAPKRLRVSDDNDDFGSSGGNTPARASGGQRRPPSARGKRLRLEDGRAVAVAAAGSRGSPGTSGGGTPARGAAAWAPPGPPPWLTVGAAPQPAEVRRRASPPRAPFVLPAIIPLGTAAPAPPAAAAPAPAPPPRASQQQPQPVRLPAAPAPPVALPQVAPVPAAAPPAPAPAAPRLTAPDDLRAAKNAALALVRRAAAGALGAEGLRAATHAVYGRAKAGRVALDALLEAAAAGLHRSAAAAAVAAIAEREVAQLLGRPQQ